MRRHGTCIFVFAAISAGCASSHESSSAPDCGCGESDGGECVDTDVPEPDGGVPGWRLTWAAQAGGDTVDIEYSYDVALDLRPASDGSVLVTGRYASEGLFGAGESNETLLPSFGGGAGLTDDFVARYDEKGELLWAKGYGGNDWDAGGTAISDPGGGTFLALGGYVAQVTVGLGEPNEISFSADTFEDWGLYSHVLSSFSTETGALQWAVPALDAGYNALFAGMAAFPDGSSVIGGLFSKEIAFAPDTPEQIVLTTAGTGDWDLALAHFSEAGVLEWGKQIVGPGVEEMGSVVRLLDGTLLVAGSYEQTIVLGAGEANETSLTCASFDSCPFLAEYSFEDGSLQWAEDLGYSCSEWRLPPRIFAAPDGGFAISGSFVGTGVLGSGEPNETVIGPAPDERPYVFIARYDDEGLLLWARQIEGETEEPTYSDSWEPGYPMAFLDSGELVVAGHYRSGAPVLGAGEPNETILPESAEYQIFIALYYPNGNLAWAIDQGGQTGMDAAPTVASYGDSTFFVGGSFADTATFGTSPEDRETLVPNGDSEIFVLRFDRTGD